MKSIMEEASSVIKAIEKAWNQAGKPQEFTIKVFEEATKNFIGMTVKPAKVAIFFQEKSQPYQQQQQARTARPTTRPVTPEHKTVRPNTQQQAPARKPHVAPERTPIHQSKPQQQRPLANTSEASITEQAGEKKPREAWTPEMVSAAQGWMQGLLSSLDKNDLTFSTEVKNYYLKINVTTPVMDDAEQEKALFRNCAYLIMQSLRNKFKKSFRGFKIILSSPR